MAAVSCVGQFSLGRGVVRAQSVMAVSSIIVIHPPWTFQIRLKKGGSEVANSLTLPCSGGNSVNSKVSAIGGLGMDPSVSPATN